MTPISYNKRQAFFKNIVQFGIISTCVTALFLDRLTFLHVVIIIGITIGIATLITLAPYFDVYRKVSTLYTDNDNNLYVDKVLVNKDLIESIQSDRPGFGPKRNQYYIMTFQELPTELKENNFNKTTIVFCELQTLSNWPNLNHKTLKFLKDVGVNPTIQYTTRK